MVDYENFESAFAKKTLDKAMPWVGAYIAASSAVCTVAMAADAFNGFRRKRLWFPSKLFSLNAISLTFLAAAMKLPIDLNTYMYESETDASAKYVSLLFMSTALANFMSSLGYMSDKEIRANVAALGILVITVALNVLTQIFLLRKLLTVYTCLTPAVLMLHLLVRLVSIAIMIPATKRRLEAKYQEQHKIALSQEVESERREAFRIDEQRGEMMKYWVMAETSSPQFVMARSVVCTTGVCLPTTLLLVLIYIYFVLLPVVRNDTSYLKPKSDYGNSTIVIQAIQLIGVVVGSIAPTLRWFSAVYFKCTAMNWNSLKKAFHIEKHWLQTLKDCRDSFSGSQIRKDKYTKCLHDAKWFAITFCIVVQIITVQLSRLLLFLSVLVTFPFLLCFIPIKIFVNRRSSKAEASGDDITNLNLGRYALLLEGEAELPERVLKNMCHEADHMIQTGRKKRPQSLLSLLRKSVSFNGVRHFDSDQIPSLHSQEPPSCWTLAVATLTSIAVAFPNTAKHKHKLLLSSVSEGFSLAKIVEKTLYESEQLANIRKAADICWVGVLLYTKWLGINLNRISKCTSSKEVLEGLSMKAKEIFTEFKSKERDPIMENPRNWPAKVVAANSMYRISRTILLCYEEKNKPEEEMPEENKVEENKPTDDALFEGLSVMIADILAACLTNLPHAIITICHRNTIEKREKSLRKAFLLLGETEQVVELLQQREWPHLDDGEAAYIEEWRALLPQGTDDPVASTSTSTSTSSDERGTSTPKSSAEEFGITVVP